MKTETQKLISKLFWSLGLTSCENNGFEKNLKTFKNATMLNF